MQAERKTVMASKSLRIAVIRNPKPETRNPNQTRNPNDRMLWLIMVSELVRPPRRVALSFDILFDRPRLMARYQFLQISLAVGLDGLGDLLADQVVVAGLLDGAEDAEGFGEIGVAHSA